MTTSRRYPGVQKQGAHWTIRYLVGKKRIRERTAASTMREAAEVREERLREVRAGTWVHPSERAKLLARGIDPSLDSPTLGDLTELYAHDWQPQLRQQGYQNAARSVIERDLGTSTPLPLLTPDRLEQWRDDMLGRGLSKSTTRHYLLWLHNVFSKATGSAKGRHLLSEGSVASNPVSAIRLPRVPPAAKDSLVLEQARHFLAVNRPADQVIFRWAFLLLRIGLRVEEAMRIQWEDVDIDAGMIRIRKTKSEKPRTVACDLLAEDDRIEDGETWEELDCWTVEPGERLIGLRYAGYASAKKRWKAAFERAELPYGGGAGAFTARNLRTTFIALAYRAGFRPEDLVAQTGHTLETLTKHYLEFVPGRRPRLRPQYPRLLDGTNIGLEASAPDRSASVEVP